VRKASSINIQASGKLQASSATEKKHQIPTSRETLSTKDQMESCATIRSKAAGYFWDKVNCE
jgi:hypothetical protein